MIKSLTMLMIMMMIFSPMQVENVELLVPTDKFNYNRTDNGMESGTIDISYYQLVIHHGTYIERFVFSTTEYSEGEGTYTFTTEGNDTIIFDPIMHTLTVNGTTYYINSTITVNWL